MKTGLLFIIFLFFITFTGWAQFVDFGQDPAYIRWRQIRTGDFQIIYPDFFEENAQKVANIYTKLYSHSNTLRHKPGKISMILHANGGISNGNVAWAPKKSELYTMPQQEPSDSWLEHLCVHEFRHVVQIDKVNQGFTKVLYHLFGEIFPIAVVGVYIPMWYIEGDAVCFETAVGHLGRGRSPEFLNEMKAQVVEKGIYGYYKAVVGSYKDYVPGRYNMGYFMTANTRANYGPDIWTKALERTGRRPFGITPFATSLKKTMASKRDSLWSDSTFRSLFKDPENIRQANTYRDAKRTLYHDNFSELQQIWKNEADKIKEPFDTIATHNKYYTNYYYPTPVGGGKLIAYKKGLQQTGAFVLLNGTKEKTLTRTGILDDYKFAVKDSVILWCEYQSNLRWEQGGRMILCSYNLNTGKYRRHKGPHNRFAPFAAGQNWGCVEVDNQNHASIVLLDNSFKKELWRITANRDELFIHPSFCNDKITTVVQSTRGLHFESIDTGTGARKPITDVLSYEIDNPFTLDSALYFRASFDGNNSIYRKEENISNILNAPFGVNFPALNPAKDSLFFSFYTSNGYKPGKVKLSGLQNKTVEMVHFRLADTLKKQENWKFKFDVDSVYKTKKYNKFTHLVNIHSWGPLYTDLNQRDVDLGLVVYSQNKLSTLTFSAGYLLNTGDDYGKWMLRGSYKGWWPIIDFNYETTRENRYSQIQAQNNVTNTTDNLYVYSKASRSSADITLRLPFNLSRKNTLRSLQPYARYKVEAIHNYHPKSIYSYQRHNNTIYLTPRDKNDYLMPGIPALYYQLLEYGLIFNNQSRMTEQEINPRWGQRIEAGYTHTPLKELNLGYQWWSDARFYFPGLFRNHSLSAYAGYQKMSERERNYSNKILSPRGISLYGYEVSSLRTGYHLPLLYPDQHISSLLYIKGVDGCAFFDIGKARSIYRSQTFYSYGVELTTNTHVLRLTYPINMGIRTGYETQHKRMFVNFIFSIGLSI